MPSVYRIRDWDEYFENYKSRERDSCSFVCVPNKQHGYGLLTILGESDGLAIYGAWNLLLGLCSRQRLPRLGWLTKDGKEGGKPLSPADLAKMFRRPEQEIQRSLEVLSSEDVGWIEKSSTREVPAEYPPSTPEVPARDRKAAANGSSPPSPPPSSPPSHSPLLLPPPYSPPTSTEGKEGRKEDCDEPASGQSSPPSAASASSNGKAAFPTFTTTKGRKKGPTTWTLTEAYVRELTDAFPAVDVIEECRRAWVWTDANPSRIKTAEGMKEFLRRWVAKEQDRGGSRRHHHAEANGNGYRDLGGTIEKPKLLTPDQKRAMRGGK